MNQIEQNRVEQHQVEQFLVGAAKFLVILAVVLGLAMPLLAAQSGSQAQQPANSQPSNSQPSNPKPSDDIPDAPSAVQPPAPKPLPEAVPPGQETPYPDSSSSSSSSTGQNASQQPASTNGNPALPPMPPVQTVAPGIAPRNQVNPTEDLYKISVTANFVQLPVMVKDTSGRRVDGLTPKDFTVLENGKKQNLTFFTSDPFELSVAVLIDLGMHDVTVQKINQTYSSLVGAFSPYDEVAVYTYSSTVSQVSDFTGKPARLTATLDQLKLVTGRNNGPPVLDGPLAQNGPMVNGLPVNGPPVAPVNTPPREAHVLNDAILRAALDLSKRDRTRRKVIFVISDGQELGSSASYRQVLRLLLAQGIQIKAVAVGGSGMPVIDKVEKFRIWDQGYSNILPKYTYATGGGMPIAAITANAMETAYAELTSEARNQYTLGYVPQATTGGAAYRTIEVQVDRRGLKVSAKDGYYPMPSVH